MQLITAKVSAVAFSLGVSPETVTEWLWDEFHREDETLVDSVYDTVDAEARVTEGRCKSEWSPETRCWKAYRAAQYKS